MYAYVHCGSCAPSASNSAHSEVFRDFLKRLDSKPLEMITVGYLRKVLIAGLLVWLPVIATYLVVTFLVAAFDSVLNWLPQEWRPEALFGFDIPGLGVIISLVVILVTGVLVANIIGAKIIGLGDNIVGRIPLIRSIYLGTKQIVQTVVGSGDQTFQKVYLLEYPRRDLWTICFQTSTKCGEAQSKIPMPEQGRGDVMDFPQVVDVFVPTTPNPTSGYFLMVPRNNLIELEMSVDDALKMVISGGVVVPEYTPKESLKDVPESTLSDDKSAGLMDAIPPKR